MCSMYIHIYIYTRISKYIHNVCIIHNVYIYIYHYIKSPIHMIYHYIPITPAPLSLKRPHHFIIIWEWDARRPHNPVTSRPMCSWKMAPNELSSKMLWCRCYTSSHWRTRTAAEKILSCVKILLNRTVNSGIHIVEYNGILRYTMVTSD